ncbi:Creatininase [Prochlorococcus marinus str. MIT 9215]|uniref:Creatininase n=1 Tax=Prochlorococcus marinus (strain MIT 9215) TaxID=93060 RepID=A8G3P6_PROM2|nr:creatininase family protein [Prochlorococcus marinus]ABV50227.1 Creatininase [Prochlorococcus marinus str. MIT 9215]
MNFKPIPNKFEYLNWQEIESIAKYKRSTVIWPFGAVEQHGPHLPLATDSIFVDEIISEVFKLFPPDIPIKKLPTQYIGFSPEHKGFAGTISLSSNLIISMIKEVGGQLSEMGFKRLILINGHGGQISLLNTASRELRSFAPNIAVFPCFLWSGVDGVSELLTKTEIENGLHASLAETSLMLALKPELVGDERPNEIIKGQIPEGWSLEGNAPTAWLTDDFSKSGVIGDSRGANANLGNDLKNLLIGHWYKLIMNLMKSDWPN